MKRIASIAVIALLTVSSPAHAVFLQWSGSGLEGFDPFGHRWTTGESLDFPGSDDPTRSAWGMPGAFNGQIPFLPVDELVTDFHVTFTNLPAGASISNVEFIADAAGAFEVWNPMFMGNNTIWFLAPAGTSLDTGEIFFVNVFFNGLPSGGFTDTTVFPNGVEFQAEWTMDGVVPEPGTLAVWTILALAFTSLSIKRRRHR